MNVEWLILGGGIHGVHIAARLIGEAGVDPEQLRIVDPGERLLARWRAVSATTGMTHLRSPSVHNLDLEPQSLKWFAGRRKARASNLFVRPYERPCLALFNAHCEQVIETFGLAGLHIRGRATGCSIDCDGVTVQSSDGDQIVAQRVVLAIGAGEQPHWPSWAPRGDARVRHIFEQDFDGWPASTQSVVVVGGGISAGQVALRLLGQGHCVHLVSRHALREHQFDSDSGWLGPRHMAGFCKERDVNRRRELIAQARHRGSMPPDIQRALARAIAREQLSWHQSEVEWVGRRGADLSMLLATGTRLKVQRVLLATGFTSRRPGGALIDELVESASLPCARCGYPIVDTALRWHPRVYVSGPLAELELGPASRNIAGARRAGDRLVEAARRDAPPCAKAVLGIPGGAARHPVHVDR